MHTVRLLHVNEYYKYLEFMSKQDDRTKRAYYGYPVSKDAHKQLMMGIINNAVDHHFVVAEDCNKNIVGILHMAHVTLDTMELAICVDPALRRKGVANQMMELAKVWCQNRGYKNIGMYYVNENLPVAKLAMKHGLGIYRKNSGDDFAYTDLPKPSPMSWWSEAVIIQIYEYQNFLNSLMLGRIYKPMNIDYCVD